jgi:hypothetical protein
MKARTAIAASVIALFAICATPASALKYAESEHNLKVEADGSGSNAQRPVPELSDADP